MRLAGFVGRDGTLAYVSVVSNMRWSLSSLHASVIDVQAHGFSPFKCVPFRVLVLVAGIAAR